MPDIQNTIHSGQKMKKTFRFVLRGMHHSTEPEAIKEQLYELGREVANIHNIKHRIT